MKFGRFDKALEGLEEIRQDHENGKKLFIDELNSSNSVDDLKRIITNHVKLFFDDTNFNFHMTKQSLRLIRDLNEKLKKSPQIGETGEIGEGEVEQTVQSVIDTVEEYIQERSKEKEDKGILNGKL